MGDRWYFGGYGLHAVNSMRLYDLENNARNEQRAGDLRERASSLARKAGAEPLSLYEFQKNANKDGGPSTLRNMLIGAGIGLAISAVVGAIFFATALIPLVIIGAAAGGVMGAYVDTNNSRREGVLNRYETYLDGFEQSNGLGMTLTPELGTVSAAQGKYVADLLAERQKAQKGILVP